MVRRMAVLLVCALVLAMCVQRAQAKVHVAKDFSSVLAGKVVPLSMKLKSLDASWHKFTMGPGMDYYSLWDPLSAAGYTRGDVITVGGETFLVAYRPKQDPSYQRALSRGGMVQGQPPKLTADTPVVLVLMNLRTLSGVSPMMTPFNLKTEIADYEKAAQEIAAARRAEQEMYTRGMAGESPLSTLAMALEMYITDYDALPPMENADAVRAALAEYVPNDQSFNDQTTGQPYGVNTSLSGKRMSDIQNPAQTVVFFQTQPGADNTRELAFLDGHTQRVSEDDWAKLKQQSGITE